MKRILLTGGAGYIGSHISLLLLECGYDVIVVDSFVNSSKKSLENVKEILDLENKISSNKIKIIEGDLRDYLLLDSIFSESIKEGLPIEGVIHLAGLKAVGESVENPIKYWNANVLSAINLFQVMNKYFCETIIFSSSATIYGPTNSGFIDENAKINPINPYGSTKVAIEMMLKDIYKSAKTKWKIANLRYFNPIGAHPSGKLGEEPFGKPNNIFPLITGVASGKYKSISIYGNDWDTHDGTGVRDYIHVLDLAKGHILTLEYLMKNKSKLLNLNLGTGKGTSVLELINIFEDTNNIKIPYVFENRREGDLSCVIADNSLACKILHWEPKRSISDMCSDGWKWEMLKNKSL